MEISYEHQNRHDKNPASMEPRFFKRGNHQFGKRADIDLWASMEPRFFKRGNLHLSTIPTAPDRASMEPRFFKRGNRFSDASSCNGLTPLQWSHVFSNVEISLRTRRSRICGLCFNGATFFQTWKSDSGRAVILLSSASMEPRFFKRGNKNAPRGIEAILNASMEPRFFKRGNLLTRRLLMNSEPTLQWSHVFSNVEIPYSH